MPELTIFVDDDMIQQTKLGTFHAHTLGAFLQTIDDAIFPKARNGKRGKQKP